MPIPPSRRLALLALLLPLLAGCEQLAAQLGLPDAKKEAAMAEAEGKATGSACRHSGRALEDCYTLNPGAAKAAVFAGWREMNDYMTLNKLEVIPSQLPSAGLMLPKPKSDAPKADEHADASPTPSAHEPTGAEEPRRRRPRRSESGA
jgi:hypothetical protein